MGQNGPIKIMKGILHDTIRYKIQMLVISLASMVFAMIVLFLDSVSDFLARDTYVVQSIVPLVSYEDSLKSFSRVPEHSLSKGTGPCQTSYATNVDKDLLNSAMTQVTLLLKPMWPEHLVHIQSSNKVVSIFFHGESPRSVCLDQDLLGFEIAGIQKQTGLTVLFRGTLGELDIEGYSEKTERLEILLLAGMLLFLLSISVGVFLFWRGHDLLERANAEIAKNRR